VSRSGQVCVLANLRIIAVAITRWRKAISIDRSWNNLAFGPSNYFVDRRSRDKRKRKRLHRENAARGIRRTNSAVGIRESASQEIIVQIDGSGHRKQVSKTGKKIDATRSDPRVDSRKEAARRTRSCSVYRKHLTLGVNNELPFHYLTHNEMQ